MPEAAQIESPLRYCGIEEEVRREVYEWQRRELV